MSNGENWTCTMAATTSTRPSRAYSLVCRYSVCVYRYRYSLLLLRLSWLGLTDGTKEGRKECWRCLTGFTTYVPEEEKKRKEKKRNERRLNGMKRKGREREREKVGEENEPFFQNVDYSMHTQELGRSLAKHSWLASLRGPAKVTSYSFPVSYLASQYLGILQISSQSHSFLREKNSIKR